MRPSRFASLLAACALLAPRAPAQPHTIELDGLRDSAYVLIAEDTAGDFPVAGAQYAWADLRRLYATTDDDHLYVYVDLPNYDPANAAGELGLAVVISGTTATGARADPFASRAEYITYAYTGAVQGTCAATPLGVVRHPDVLFRGYVYSPANPDNSDGYLARFVGGSTAWTSDFDDWGGLNTPSEDHIAYYPGEGLEFSVPWTDLNLDGPVDLNLSFFTTAAGLTTGILDVIPPDVAATTASTSTVLSQLAALSLPLPAPVSISWGCQSLEVAEAVGTAQLTAQLHGVLTETVAVSYTTTALTAGLSDFTPVTGTVTFAPGLTRQTVAVPITPDTAIEANETFRVTLSSPQGIALTSPSTVTVTITDDDDELPPVSGVFVPIVLR